MKTVLITGATAGIGQAIARLLADNNYRLILCGRREERLRELEGELGAKVPVHTLKFDVRNQTAVFEAVGSLPKDFSNIDVLVNNAGNAHGLAPIDEGSTDDWDAMIDINVKGLLYVSKAVIPNMVTAKSGHVVNIGSTAGKEVYPGGNVYCASKHAVDAINQGMRIDLHQHNIRVTAINPGLVETEFSMVRFKGDEERAKKVYEGLEALQGEDIAALVLFAITRPPHVNIADLVVMPQAQATATIVNRK